MNKFTTAVKAFIADEDGVTAIEYALMAAMIGVGLAGATTALTGGLADAFTALGTKISSFVNSISLS